MVIVKGKVNGKDKNGGQIIEPKIIVDEANVVSIKEAKEYQPLGKKSILKTSKNNKKAIIADEEQPNEGLTDKAKRLYMRMPDASNQQTLQMLKDILDINKGASEAVLVLGSDSKQIIKLPQKVEFSEKLANRSKRTFGQRSCQISIISGLN